MASSMRGPTNDEGYRSLLLRCLLGGGRRLVDAEGVTKREVVTAENKRKRKAVKRLVWQGVCAMLCVCNVTCAHCTLGRFRGGNN